MEKDYLKKFIDLGGSEFLAYDQFSVPEGDRDTLRAPFEGAADEELDVSEQLDATGYGPTPAEGTDDELDDVIEADEIPEHEGLVAAYFREMLRYSILSPEEERSLGRIIKEGQDNILNLVSVAAVRPGGGPLPPEEAPALVPDPGKERPGQGKALQSDSPETLPGAETPSRSHRGQGAGQLHPGDGR